MPTSDEGEALRSPSGKTGRYSSFQRGSMNWIRPTNQTFLIQGAIYTKWASMGHSGGQLGFPQSDEYPYLGGSRSDFEGGSIAWTASTGAKVIPKTSR